MSEVCRNPWKRKKCEDTDIVVYIRYLGRVLPVCRRCWRRIAKSNREGVLTGRRVDILDLKICRDLFIRFRLDEDEVQRYMELYRSGWEKAIRVQAGTNVVIDGFHMIEACKRLGLKKILVEPVEVDDKDLRALAYKYNRSHGVPLILEERNNLIAKLYFEDGKTQQQIADLVGLSQNRVSEILASSKTDNSNNSDCDKRRELSREEYATIARLILGGEKRAVGLLWESRKKGRKAFRNSLRQWVAENVRKIRPSPLTFCLQTPTKPLEKSSAYTIRSSAKSSSTAGTKSKGCDVLL